MEQWDEERVKVEEVMVEEEVVEEMVVVVEVMVVVEVGMGEEEEGKVAVEEEVL